MQNGETNEKVPEVFSSNNTPIFLKDNAVALYTMLAILTRIRAKVGLEAMLEYIGHYQMLIERHNPDFKEAVAGALSMVSVEKLYGDMVTDKNK